MAHSETAGDELGVRRRRLQYRAWHRGTREMDLILGPFADAHLAGYATAELDRFERLMDADDADLLGWVLEQVAAPAGADEELIDRLRTFRTKRNVTR